jgi:transposase
VVRLEIFQTIAVWHRQRMPVREIARRLDIDRNTVRRIIRKIEAGAQAPSYASRGSKLAPFEQRIAELAALGRTAWSICGELKSDPSFSGSYDLVKRRVRELRVRDPKVYERLEHPPSAEAQVDFAKLGRVRYGARMVTTWSFVMTWPHSHWVYEDVVIDQTVPTFLGCIQDAIWASGSAPQRLTPDNLASAVLRQQLGLRPYQRDFANFCAHYDIAPSPARPRTPTDKGSVERGVRTLRAYLKGRSFETYEQQRAAVKEHMSAYNDRAHSTSGKKPNDLIVLERRGELPSLYPLARWGEYRVRADCHIQVKYNFYSVPYRLVGKKVAVRIDRDTVAVYDDLEQVALHPCCRDRGCSITDRGHYPPYKRLASQDIRAERVAQIRSVGPCAADFLHGLLRSREYVHSDLYRQLVKIVNRYDHAIVEQACRRAVHFGAFDLAKLRHILERQLYELPLDDLFSLQPPPAPKPSSLELVRPLEAYSLLYGGTHADH